LKKIIQLNLFSMKFYPLFLSFLFFSSQSPAQDFSKIDAQARQVAAPENNDIAALSKALSAGCQNEKEKARSFFVWMAENIRYDMKTFSDMGAISAEKAHTMQAPEEVLKRKKAVCDGYTNLYNALCTKAGIRALKVIGLAKDETSEHTNNSHAWSIICADGQWALVDATWGTGYEDVRAGKYRQKLDDKYFFTIPDLLIEDHYPNDPLFQCMATPLTLAEFFQSSTKLQESIQQKILGDTVAGYTHIRDSLNALFPYDSTNFMRGSGKRSLQINPNSYYGCWALGSYYDRLATNLWNDHNRALIAIKPNSPAPGNPWFEKQEMILKQWETNSTRSLHILKIATGTDDGYVDEVRSLIKYAQSSLDTCHKQMAQIKRYKAETQKR